VTGPAAPPRYASIDVVKGCAILWVLLIHSQALGSSPLFSYLVNRAVPLFVVLFGVNSELWWRRRTFPDALGEWLRNRARRVLLPMWAMLPVWWALVLWFQPAGVHLSKKLAAAHAVGYLYLVGTGWFVTLIIQLVLVFPLMHALARRFGGAVVLAAGLACTVACAAFVMWLVWVLGFFNHLVFAPRYFGLVAFGMVLAPALGRLGLRAALAGALGYALAVAIQEGWTVPGLAPYAERLMDLPLTVLLLPLAASLVRVPLVGSTLVWLGQSSYGVYLGQLLTHNAFIYAYGFPDFFFNPWLYTGFLLAGGLVAVCLGEALLRLWGGLGRPRFSLPTLAR
jgi:peptidoglycan/LPS O-acetylase OafA/YrhL